MTLNTSLDIGRAPDGTFWWPLDGDRSGYYAICPRDTTTPMQLAVQDDMGRLVPVPSIGAHAGFAGFPA